MSNPADGPSHKEPRSLLEFAISLIPVPYVKTIQCAIDSLELPLGADDEARLGEIEAAIRLVLWEEA